MNITVDYSTIKAGKRFDTSNPITAAFNAITRSLLTLGYDIVPEGDVVFVFGSITKRKLDTERAISIQKHRERGAKILSLDSSLFSTYIRRKLDSSETNMFRIGLNDCTGEGNFLNEESGPERYEWFKRTFDFKESDPRADNKGPIFFALQSEKGWQYDNTEPYYEWARSTIEQIRRLTNRTILLKPHPNTDRHPIEWIARGFDNIRIIGQDRSRRHIIDDFRGVGCFVTHSSSAACESIVEGIPTIALDKRCVVYKDCEKDFEKINRLQDIDWSFREQSLRDWAMSSWSISELSNPQLVDYYVKKAIQL